METMETNQNSELSLSKPDKEINGGPDLTMQPVIRKSLKPEVQRKLIKRAVMNIVPENPIGALHALFEKESFCLECFDSNQIHKAVLRIDGRVFEKVSTQKRKARDGVVIDALVYLFSDIVNDMKNKYLAAIEQQNIIMLSKVSDSVPNVASKTHKLAPSDHSDQDDVCVKKIKQDLPSSAVRPLVKKELKPEIVERLVKQAVGLLECDNPNTVTALFSLFEKDVFSFEVVQLNQNDVKFQANLRVGNRRYTDTAISIKKAKSNVTRKALHNLFPEYAGHDDQDVVVEEVEENSNHQNSITMNEISRTNADESIVSESKRSQEKSQSFSDFIAHAVQSKYKEIVQDQPDYLRRYSVLSGIVMIQNNDTSSACVIAVSTGNKCLRGDQVSTNGDVLFDCHAEILSKRCLISYIYSQLLIAITTDHETILESGDHGLLRIKDTVKFYLFISSSPCGDGRVFNFAPAKNPDRKKLSVKRGMLRVKLESGMGGIPVSEYSDMTTTYEGYLIGKPLVLMCCSAKLLRANILGVQGALLSQIIEPVYFAGVLIGDIFHKDNLARALYGRLTLSDDAVPPPYRINRHSIEGITNSKIATNVKPGKSCMNWVVCDPIVEFINTKTGKTCDEQVSRLCKLNLFKKYLEVSTLMKKTDSSSANFVYITCKESSAAYQKVRQMLVDDLENSCRGKWLAKPKELNNFCVTNFSGN